MDQQITLSTLKEVVAEFVAARQWQPYHNPKNLAASIGIESAELMEHFQWLTDNQSADLIQDPQAKAEIADELADVLIYCLSFANTTDIDISQAVITKLERNELRFPRSNPQTNSSGKH